MCGVHRLVSHIKNTGCGTKVIADTGVAVGLDYVGLQ